MVNVSLAWWLLFIFLAVLLPTAGCIEKNQGAVPSISVPSVTGAPNIMVAPEKPVTREDLVAFVERAAGYAKQYGRNSALSEFNKKNSSFFEGQLYIYAYDFNGTTIAHPVNPEKIGVNRLDEKDAAGNLFVRELRDMAENGSGFVEYYYLNPAHNNAIEKKLGYVMKIDDSWWLGSGIYTGTAGM